MTHFLSDHRITAVSCPSLQACSNMTLFSNLASFFQTSLYLKSVKKHLYRHRLTGMKLLFLHFFLSNLIWGNNMTVITKIMCSYLPAGCKNTGCRMKQALTIKKYPSLNFSFKPHPICCDNSGEGHWAILLAPQACLWCLFSSAGWKRTQWILQI